MADSTTSVDLFFDPGCPFTWVTSRWLIKASQQRNFTINARPFSLKIKNRDGVGSPYELVMKLSHEALRVFVAVDQELGNEKAFAFYSERGYQYFPNELDSPGPDLTKVLKAVSIDQKFAEYATDESLDEIIRTSTERAAALAGTGVGSPIISLPGTERGFFGPVLDDVPKGEAAGTLWDHVNGLLQVPELSELKRDRTGELAAPPRE